MKNSLLLFQYILIAFVIWMFFVLAWSLSQMNWASIWAYRSTFLSGWFVTIGISIISLFFSTLIGSVVALLGRTDLPILTWISRTFIEIIRGTPLLVQLLFFYYVIANQIGLQDRFIAGILTLSLFHGAYIAEMIRSGIENISKTQLDSAKAIGLSPFDSYRFVIIPQAMRQVLPPLSGQFASIIKDSSLLSIIGINEVTNVAQQINSATYNTLESFFPLAAAYLILTLPISILSKKLEQRYRYET